MNELTERIKYEGEARDPPFLPDLPIEVERALESWGRIIALSDGPDRKRINFERAVIELQDLARTFPHRLLVYQQIMDEMESLGELAGVPIDERQDAIAAAAGPPPKANGYEIEAADKRDDQAPEPWPPDQPGDPGPQLSPSALPAALQQPPVKLSPLKVSELAGQAIPDRRWLARDRIPIAKPSLLYGDGGTGKTLIALQLAAATVRGTDWFGSLIEEPGPAIYHTAEEDQDEMHRRLAAIADHGGYDLTELDRLHLICRPEADNVLGAADRNGTVRPTPLFEGLKVAAAEIRPKLIVIEAAADVFAVNENDRSQARQAVALLRQLALAVDAAVLLLAHPSLTGISSGRGTSGSTAWSNSARSRLYFANASTDEADDVQADVRELSIMKANYARKGDRVRVRWHRGVFVPEVAGANLEQRAAEAVIDRAYLECLDAATAQGRDVFPNPGVGWAPKVFAGMPQAGNAAQKGLAAAQERLLAVGRIKIEARGRARRIVRADRAAVDVEQSPC